ncbi:MAG: hypothetical protein E7260_12210 [Lachnospiraceae bacterium]|nr:hypothetical protein [Lachnospiraceae bacterium]
MIKCPKCKSEKVAPIVYGIPADDMLEGTLIGDVIFGGEGYEGGEPDYGCLTCDYKWSKEAFFAEDITKLRFKVIENGPCLIDDAHRWVYEIFSSEKVVKYTYIGRSRRYVVKEEAQANLEDVMRVYDILQYLVRIRWSDEVVCEVCDGCSYELQISYVDCRKEIHSGDIGGGTVDTLLMRFLNELFDEDDGLMDSAKIEELINWWLSSDTQGMDIEKYLLTPVMDALGDNIDDIFEFLNDMEPEDLLVISGCFEMIYKKFMIEEVWNKLEALERKCGIII